MLANKYKILHIVSNPFFLNRGGLIRNLEQVYGTLKMGHDVLVCSYSGGENVDGIRIKRIPWVFWYKNTAGGAHDLHRLYLDLSLFFYSLYILIKFRPDVIHTHGLTGVLSAKLFKLFFSKCVIIQDSEGSYADEIITSNNYKLIKSTIVMVERIIYNLTDGLTVCNEDMKKVLKERYKISKPAVFLPEGLSPKIKRGRLSREELGIDNDKVIIGFAGQFHAHQRLDLMMNSFEYLASHYDNIKFLIIGYPVEKLLKDYPINEKSLNKYIFLGQISFLDIQNYLGLMDIGVSYKTFESSAGNGKILDYIAAHLPVVCFDHSVNRFYLKDVGVYCLLGDVEDFNSQIGELIASSEKRMSLKRKMQDLDLSFDWDYAPNLLLSFYNTLLNK
jgi:glycosyltransferase involved in cell wall biosynthesis